MRRTLEFVTLGETMLRLMAPVGQSLEAAERLDVGIAGAESNVAVALARLGHRTAWISRLPDNPLGRMVSSRIHQHGVDVSRVVWANSDERLGIYYWESGATPRPGRVMYDRRNSAFSGLTPSDVDWDYVREAQWLHLTGITAALGNGALGAVQKSLEVARASGCSISFDVNYRSALWPAELAARTLSELLHCLNVVFVAARDLRMLFDLDGPPERQCREMAERFHIQVVVVTRGAEGAVAWDGSMHHVSAMPVEIVDPIGRGDAFAAGFLHGLSAGDTLQALRSGTALAALKQTYRGDFVWTTREELDAALASDGTDIKR